jgi:hypothetical protein
VILIPTETDVPLYEQRVTLDGRDYLLLFDYNQRNDRYYLTISAVDGAILSRGHKLVTGTAIGPRIADRRMFRGALIVQTTTVDDSPPGFGELGEEKRCQLYYVSEAEYASLA